MAQKNKRKSWTHTIKRWFGLKAERANDLMDDSVDVETLLNRKLKEFQDKYNELSNGDRLARALGLASQLEEELTRENRKYAQENYEMVIRQLMQSGKREEAGQVLIKKDKHEQKIQQIKENYKMAQQSRDSLQEDLRILQTNMEKVRADLEDYKQRNRMAEQQDEIYELMNEFNGIDLQYDSEGIRARVEEQERQAHGRRIMHQQNSAVSHARHEAEMANINSRLNDYL